jgi:hypothetical protein
MKKYPVTRTTTGGFIIERGAKQFLIRPYTVKSANVT